MIEYELQQLRISLTARLWALLDSHTSTRAQGNDTIVDLSTNVWIGWGGIASLPLSSLMATAGIIDVDICPCRDVCNGLGRPPLLSDWLG